MTSRPRVVNSGRRFARRPHNPARPVALALRLRVGAATPIGEPTVERSQTARAVASVPTARRDATSPPDRARRTIGTTIRPAGADRPSRVPHAARHYTARSRCSWTPRSATTSRPTIQYDGTRAAPPRPHPSSSASSHVVDIPRSFASDASRRRERPSWTMVDRSTAWSVSSQHPNRRLPLACCRNGQLAAT
jgi:hypothetical protein